MSISLSTLPAGQSASRWGISLALANREAKEIVLSKKRVLVLPFHDSLALEALPTLVSICALGTRMQSRFLCEIQHHLHQTLGASETRGRHSFTAGPVL